MTPVNQRQDGDMSLTPPAPEGRRHIPLREVTLPHTCPRPVRMYVLARTPYFQGLTEDELDAVDRRMRSISWPAGSSMYQAGQPADALYVVAEGRVKISQTTASGTETVTDILVPGELFGAIAQALALASGWR